MWTAGPLSRIVRHTRVALPWSPNWDGHDNQGLQWFYSILGNHAGIKQNGWLTDITISLINTNTYFSNHSPTFICLVCLYFRTVFKINSGCLYYDIVSLQINTYLPKYLHQFRRGMVKPWKEYRTSKITRRFVVYYLSNGIKLRKMCINQSNSRVIITHVKYVLLVLCSTPEPWGNRFIRKSEIMTLSCLPPSHHLPSYCLIVTYALRLIDKQ